MKVLFLLSVLFLVSCKIDNTYRYFQQLASGSIESSSDLFYLKINTDEYTDQGRTPIPLILSSLDGDEFDISECGVHKEEEAVEDKYCIVDINEMDLHPIGEDNPDIKIEYSVPPKACAYTSLQFPYHFNQETGPGPRVISKYEIEIETETGEDSKTKKCTYYATGDQCPSPNFKGLTLTERTDDDVCKVNELGWSTATEDKDSPEDFFCGEYLKPTPEDRYETCCIGEYQEIDCKERNASEIKEWQGSIQACIGGAAKLSWDHYSDDNLKIPVPFIFPTWDNGKKDTVVLNRLARQPHKAKTRADITSHGFGYSLSIANYYTGIEDLEWQNGFDNGKNFFFTNEFYRLGNDTQTISQRDRVHIPIYTGYPYYTLECLDENMETLKRVHLIIREWNDYKEFTSYLESEGRTGDPDKEGTEGQDCDLYEPDEFSGSTCNDLYDLDDVIQQERPCIEYCEELRSRGIINSETESICRARCKYPFIPKDFLN